MLAERGWTEEIKAASVTARWDHLVGADVAGHCQPESLRDGELVLVAESTAWAAQLRLLAPALLARLATELGAGYVRRLQVRGPTAPSWRHGPWTVSGSRGPGDTYG